MNSIANNNIKLGIIDKAKNMNNEINFNIAFHDKFYPEANKWMWNYCTFLGKFTDSENNNYDLGIVFKDSGVLIIGEWCSAIVYDNVHGSYISSGDELDKIEDYTETRECIIEMKRRAKLLNLI
jgi:hypothetical protein